MLAPQLVVLEADLPGESGWLTCEKLTGEQSPVRVLLVGPAPTPEQHAFAAFVGAAALVDRAGGAAALLPPLHPAALPAAG
jgi:hypothetical protein